MDGVISDEEAEEIFGDWFDEVKGAKLMRESIQNTDDPYLEGKDLSP